MKPQSFSHQSKTAKTWVNISNLLALTVCLCVFIGWLNLLLEKLNHFGYYDWDLAIYANAMWALTQGSFSGSLWGVNFLTNHAEYIAVLLAPIYWVFPGSTTLLTLKLFSVIGGGFVLYLIAKEKLGWKLGISIMLLYFAFPANAFMLIFEFHFESLAIIFIFLVYYFLRVRLHYRNFVICCILACLCKENIPPIIFMFGLMGIFEKDPRQRIFSWTAMVIGGGIFIIGFLVLTPWLRHLEGFNQIASPYVSLYLTENKDLPFTENLINNTKQMFTILFNPLNKRYLEDLFLSLFLIPLLRPKTLLIGLPLFLQAMLSKHAPMHTIYYHYAATVTPFLFLSTVVYLNWISEHSKKWILSVLVIMLALSIAMKWSAHKAEFYKRTQAWHDDQDFNRRALLQKIPPQEGVIATFEFLSHLADRNEVYPLRNIWQGQNIFRPHKTFQPPTTRYALIDWEDEWLYTEGLLKKDVVLRRKKLSNLKDFYFQNNWVVKAAKGEITLLENVPKRQPLHQLLVEVQKQPYQEKESEPLKNIRVGDKITLQNTQFRPGQTSVLTFYWLSNHSTDDVYVLDIHLYRFDKRLKTWRHTIGYGAYPTALWEAGDHIKEAYWFDTDQLLDGIYHIAIRAGNLTEDRWVKMNYNSKETREVLIGSFTVKSPKGAITHEK